MFFWRRAKQKKARGLTSLTNSLDTNIHWFKQDIFANDETIIYRRFRTGDPQSRACVLVFAEHMVKHEFLSEHIVRAMMQGPLPGGLHKDELITYVTEHIIHSNAVTVTGSFSKLSELIVGGRGVLLVDGCDLGIAVDAQGWAKRQVTEPPSENVVRGPRQGFTEDLGGNVALVQRRITNPAFKTKFMTVGTQSNTKVAVVYVDSVASQALVDEVIDRIEKIEIDAVLDSGYIQELIQDSPYSPMPTIGHTERPDIVAGKILEGRVAVLVDGSPFALTMPYLFVEAFQSNEDYYNHWVPATFHRIVRYISFFITTSTPALYLALISYHPQLIPTNLVISIAASRQNVPFPGIVEVVAMGLVFEILREGGVRLPRPVGQAISIVGAIVLGDAAVSASLVSAPMIIVVGITAVAGFVISPLYNTAVLMRLFLVLTSSILGFYGFVLGVMAIVIHLASIKSFGVPYLTSMTEFLGQNVKDAMVRVPWWRMNLRPKYVAAQDRKRLQSAPGRKNR